MLSMSAHHYPGVQTYRTGSTMGTVLAKFFASLVGGFLMYWMYIPRPIEVLLIMMGIDLFLGSAEAWTAGAFTAKQFWRGIMKKFIAFPVLVACDQVEAPLHLTFHLDDYFAYALTVYEFISIVEVYARMGGPVPKVLMSVSEKARDLLSSGMYEIPAVRTTEDTIKQTHTSGQPQETVTTHTETTVQPVNPTKP